MASRGQFSSRLGFVAAAAGSAVGLGNIWKFPFEVGQGGGAAFVLMYLFFCFLLCFPIMVTEIAMGRKTQKNPVGAFNALGFSNWNIVGKLGIVSGFLILSFYNVVAGWSLGYCVELFMGNFGIGKEFSTFTNDVIKIGIYGILFMSTTAYIVSRGISGGIEKASKILMPTLIIIILSLVVYSLTLPDATKGVAFYLFPDLSKINLKVVYGALGQAFFSLSLGMGALMTYGSYIPKSDNIITSATLITLTDVGIAFIAGLMMFPFVGFMSGGSMEGVEGGAGLIFTILPEVFQRIGSLGAFIGGSFFLLLSFAALTSTVSLLEVPVAYVVDEYDTKRKPTVWLMALAIFLVGIPSLLSQGYSGLFSNFITYFGAEKATDFMTVVENISSDTFLPLGGLLISIFAAYVWKKKNLMAEIEQGYPGFSNTWLATYMGFAISFLCPVVLSIIFILTVMDRFFSFTPF